MKTKLLIPIIMVLALATTVMAGDFKIQNSTFSDLFAVTGVDGNATFLGGISIATDGLDEAGIFFITDCPSGSRLYVNAGNLACEVGGNTTEEIQDIYGAAVDSNTETGITVTYDDADGTLDFVVTGNTTNDVIDAVGGSVTGNTETGIAVTYETADNTFDFVVTDTNTNASSVCSATEYLEGDGTCDDLISETELSDLAELNTQITDATFVDTGTMTGDKYCIYDDGQTEINCTMDAPGGLDNVVEDTTPQLGGSLDIQTFAIDSGTGTTNMSIDGSGNLIIVLA